jgi:multidrug resistance efflux pump
MNPLEPVSIPAVLRWREFRIQFVPIVACLAIGAVTVWLWKNQIALATTQGVGEGVRSFVAAPQPAQIEKWLVEPYSIVTAGTPLLVVKPVDARVDFDLLRSLFEMARVQSQPTLAEGNAMNFERIRVELLKTKSELAIARVKLEQAERDVTRNEPLFREKLVSADIYELSLNTRDALKAEVDEKNKAVEQIEQRLTQLRPIGEPDPLGEADPVVAQWLKQLKEAQTDAARHLEPLTIVAPISGMVDVPRRQGGDFVLAGEPLLTISALRSDRVVAYLRQPYRVDPKVGMTARVTTRTQKREVFSSHVIQVGAQLEVLTNSLAIVRPGAMVDAGLPVIVHVPEEVSIRPGEIVDVLLSDSREEITAKSVQTESSRQQPPL